METIMSPEFAKALVQARSKMGAVVKGKKNPAFPGARYADLADILEEVTEPLAEEGISLLMPLVNSPDNKVGVIIQMIYLSGESYQTDPFFIPLGKTDAQGYIAASTYARRCFATSYFCLPTEDDDGNTASGVKPQAAYQAPPRPVTPAPVKPAAPVQSAGKPELKVISSDDDGVTEGMANMYLAKWNSSYPDCKDRVGNIMLQPSLSELMTLTKKALVAAHDLLPVVVEAKKAKEAK